MKAARRLRVMIAEDSIDVREALASLIRHEPAFVLVGAAANTPDAIALATEQQPDVALLDVRMPGGGGKAAALAIRLCSPESKLVALSEHNDRATVRDMLEAGVIGYLVKGSSNKEIIAALKSAGEGHGSLSANVTNGIVQAFSEQLRVRSRASQQRRTSRARINGALRDPSAFKMVFQPIVELRGGDVVGAEALARFAGSHRRTPDVWFAEAARVGLDVQLELAAIRKSLSALPGLPSGVYLTINVSPVTLASPEFYDLVAEADCERLVAEITEHALVQDYDLVTGPVGKLRALGMRIAVDDAGAGFASFRHILEFSPELIKLDLTLVRDIDHDPSKQALATALIAFSGKIGATIVAEGVERPSEAEMLVELGVSYGQGFLLGLPAAMPLAAYAAPAN